MVTGWLIALIVILIAALFGFVLWVGRLFRQAYVMNAVSHVGCVQQVGAAVSKHHDATLLRTLADEYDALDNQANLARLRRKLDGNQGYRDTPTIPALWLREKADDLDPPAPVDPIYNLAGDRLT